MNQADYIEFHPDNDERARIITEDIFNEFKQELYKVMEGYCFVSADIHTNGEIESIKVNRYPDNKLLIAYFPLSNSLKIFQGWGGNGGTLKSVKYLIYKYLANEKNTRLPEVDPKNLEKMVYHPDSFTSTNLSAQLVNDQLVERLVEIENQMIEEAVEDQRAKQGSKFKQFLIEFKHMKPEEQNSVIYSFTDLLKRMHEIHDDSVERKYNAKIENAENQWEKFKDERRKND